MAITVYWSRTDDGGYVARRVEFCQREDGTAFIVVELSGDVDLGTDPATRAALRAAFVGAKTANAPVIIDCTKMTFLALSGIRALLETKQRYGQTAPLRLVGPP
ncbi:STAS domain-containing protein [Actinomycetospora rhizophila]|uniref:STAS domain-containing protein n=1 Tax=Actinomycetospora rhizophila TaxID=1416876 RepID=A0ABV9ZAK0_9PSEU